MIVPIDLLKPILDDLLTIGRPNRPVAPVARHLCHRGRQQRRHPGARQPRSGVAGGPARRRHRARRCRLEVSDLAGLFRRVWALGQAGVEVPLLINRDGKTFELRVRPSDRRRFLKGPVLH